MRSMLFLSSMLFIASCAVYAPNTVNVTGFNKKGQLAVSGSVGNGVNLQGAYALTNNIGAMVNYMNIKQIVETDNVKRDGSGNLLEAGIGYFKNTEGNLRMEIFAGFGQGSVNIAKTDNGTRNFSTNANRIFVQPSVGYASKNFEAFFSARAASVNYSDINTTYTPGDLEADDFTNISDMGWFFVEPAITLRAGIKNIKLQLQVGRSIKLNSQELGHDSGLLNLGAFAKF